MTSKQHNMRPPKFFKPHTLKHGSDKIKIPKAFVEYLNRFLKKVVLRNGVGKLWHVEIGSSCTDNSVYFVNGWQKFVEDNVVEPRDILVFSYDGDQSFDVKIFGGAACEKRETNGNAGIDVEFKRKEDHVIDLDDDESDDFITNEEENIEEEEEEEDDDDDDDDEEEEVNMNHWGKMNNRNKGGTSKKGVAVERFDIRNYFQTKNPYFVTKLRKGHMNQLHVPSHVLKDFGLKLVKNIEFHDEDGRTWPGKVVHMLDGRTLISGWRAVCRWNNVDKDDLCICEFPQREGKHPDVIEVHILRGVGSGNQTKT